MACLERLSRFPADERTAYLDDQIITAPTGKCAMQTGTFRYKSKMDENKTVPANRITDRQVNCRSRHRRTHGANGRRNNRDCPRTLTVREAACRRLPDREGDLRQTGLRPEISGLSPVCRRSPSRSGSLRHAASRTVRVRGQSLLLRRPFAPCVRRCRLRQLTCRSVMRFAGTVLFSSIFDLYLKVPVCMAHLPVGAVIIWSSRYAVLSSAGKRDNRSKQAIGPSLAGNSALRAVPSRQPA